MKDTGKYKANGLYLPVIRNFIHAKYSFAKEYFIRVFDCCLLGLKNRIVGITKS